MDKSGVGAIPAAPAAPGDDSFLDPDGWIENPRVGGSAAISGDARGGYRTNEPIVVAIERDPSDAGDGGDVWGVKFAGE